MAGIFWVIDTAARELMLFAGMMILLGGLDDLLIDWVYLVRRAWRGSERLAIDHLPPPRSAGRIAVLVPAWRESAVIGAMLTAALARYRHPDYLILVGAYANDRDTIDAVAAVAERDARVRLVVGPRPGPTTKADNLNAMWRALERDDQWTGAVTTAVVIHDAEDVVHPDELCLFARLLDRYDVIQLPVLPLVDPKTPLVSGHYADEFAESHAKQLVIRAALGAGMPLAGAGCAISAAMLRQVAAERGGLPFDATSLTEDYELGLCIAERGGRGLIARCTDRNGQLIAVRAYFPGEFTAAARQKARWMTGIALAGWDRIGWSRPFALVDHWMRMRDRRGPLAVVVLTAAYLAVLTYALSAVAHQQWAAPYPRPVPRWLLAATTALLGWRLAVRIAFTVRAYGWKEGCWAVPRFLVGNLIGLAAAPRALATYLPTLFGRQAVWDKTEHHFPDLAESHAPA